MLIQMQDTQMTKADFYTNDQIWGINKIMLFETVKP